MNANGQRFWMLADGAHWQVLGDPAPLAYADERHVLRLASQARPTQRPDDRAEAVARLERTPQTRDALGSRAYWNGPAGEVRATGVVPGERAIFLPAPGEIVSDLVTGYDGILYL